MLKLPVLLGVLLLTMLKMEAQDTFPVFDKEGHRGCRGLMPENTVPAMKKAIDLGVNTLEMDVVISRDNQVVLSHDAYMNPLFTLTPEGKPLTAQEQEQYILYKMDYDQIRRFDVGSKGHPGFPRQQRMKAYKPLLAELVDSVEQYTRQKQLAPVWYNIETKSVEGHDGEWQPAPETFTDLLVAVLQEKGITDRVVVQSFDKRTLQVLHRKYPDIKTSFLTSDKKAGLGEHIAALGFTPFVYSPHYKLVTPQLVQQCKEKGIKLIPWTPNTADEIAQLKALGVDGVITDYPDLF
ncbi:glycerophosphodiester phosphodiesterase family protein [Chitinophaga japonensis]|uniref:Glycerophosphoryl diester phosphodiesterase n=1 Tax=Chitinophaga japonensis TaxID=104662 RepID=A0A562T3E2_CHIJA|nr:glycerophosphodiester phosphodiesterase family protein [Chitinophaga japonensis]TWI88087.1 glycerophosphoryl diester phosphodiesterase [Chitinophaga japonensis]